LNFFYTSISDRAIQYATSTLMTGWLSEGPRVQEFETALAQSLGVANPVCVNSGTSALHLALILAGVGPGDEVILPAQTFVASGMVIRMQGASPVFADIDPETGNLSPASIREKISDRTKVILPVHWAGYPCEMQEIQTIATEHGLTVVEDAAHALGAVYKGQPIGSISRFTCFSFQAIKHLTCGDGGAVCCASETDAANAKTRRWFGIDRAHSLPSVLGERIYDVAELGYKYHMNDLAAAVGLGNLEDFQQRLERRRAIGAVYRQALSGVPGVRLLRHNADRLHAYWLFTLRVERREDFIRKLAVQGVPASVVHLRIDRNSIFGGAREDLPGLAEFNRDQVAVPLHEGLSDDDVDHVISTVRSGW
jgi:perosamine synthetase